ncbi:Teichoic acid translocation permease protein TagG [Phycisphaerae bacterium RAS2]|nr:Teichoic acid translocation permease protein TagG [Phycisphaerae bacterium RAS2]
MRYAAEFGKFLSDTWRSRWLLYELTKNDFRGRYLGSALGIVWALVQPIVTLLIMWFVFARIYKSGQVSDKPFVLWLMAGIIPWYFISESMSGGTNSIVEKSFLVSKVAFRVSILPIVKISSAMVIHLFFFAIMIVILAAYGFPPDRYYLQIPYFWFATIIFLLGISWITAALTVFFRDVSYFVSVVLQFLFWLTPIFWSPEMVHDEKLRMLLKLNPLQYLVEGYRGCVIYQRWFWEPYKSMIYFWIVTALLFFGGAVIFRRLRPHFGDLL